MSNKNNCITCQHHFITYDPDKSWGCRRFGFKSKISPKFEGKRNWHGLCLLYFEKEIILFSKRIIKMAKSPNNKTLVDGIQVALDAADTASE